MVLSPTCYQTTYEKYKSLSQEAVVCAAICDVFEKQNTYCNKLRFPNASQMAAHPRSQNDRRVVQRD